MPGIAEQILEQIERAGQPRTITQKTTTTGREPFDIGGLGLLIYMLMSQGEGAGTEVGGEPIPGIYPTEMPASFQPPGGFAGGAGQTQIGGMNPLAFLQMMIGGR